MKNGSGISRILYGFTLAEVLLTLTIVGIIASLTIPSLLQNTNNAQTVIKLKKEFSVISQAFMLLKADNGGSVTGNVFMADSNDKLINTFESKLRFIKKCNEGAAGCWYNSPTYNLDGTVSSEDTDSDFQMGGASAILVDGTIIRFYDDGGDCASNYGAPPIDKTCGDIIIDINGKSSPNKIGRDIFRFFMTQNGIYPYGIDGSACAVAGWSCTAKILREGAINY